jgi:hypothetical protein
MAMIAMRSLRTVLDMPWADRMAVLEAAALCGWAQLLLRRPFKDLAPRLGVVGQESAAVDLLAEKRHAALRVQRAISRAARCMPWDCKCLVQAIVARTMLDRRGIDGTLYLGVKRGGAQGIEAHAWIRTGMWLITGGHDTFSYSPVSAFAFGAQDDDRPRNRWSPQSHTSSDVVSHDSPSAVH